LLVVAGLSCSQKDNSATQAKTEWGKLKEQDKATIGQLANKHSTSVWKHELDVVEQPLTVELQDKVQSLGSKPIVVVAELLDIFRNADGTNLFLKDSAGVYFVLRTNDAKTIDLAAKAYGNHAQPTFAIVSTFDESNVKLERVVTIPEHEDEVSEILVDPRLVIKGNCLELAELKTSIYDMGMEK